MPIPLFNRLRKHLHVEIAMLQDEVIDIVYGISPKAVLHGGTAVWRCYAGCRFSEGLDFYLQAGEKFRGAFEKALNSRGLQLLRFKLTKNTVFSKVSNGSVEVRLEAAARKPKVVEAGNFERTDGTFLNVFTLPVGQLMLEKMEAYQDRRLVKDLYDVFVLSSVAVPDKEIGGRMRDLLGKAVKPADEKSLQTVVFSGAVPSFGQMMLALKRRFNA